MSALNSAARAALTAFVAIMLLTTHAHAQKWVKGAPFPEPATATMSATFRKVEAYEPRTNTWHTLPPMQFSRHGLAGDFVGSRLHLVSGNLQSGGGPAAHIETEAHEVLELSAK